MFGKLMNSMQQNFNPQTGGDSLYEGDIWEDPEDNRIWNAPFPSTGQGKPEMGEDQDWWQRMIGRGKGMGGLMKMALMQMNNPGASDKMSIPRVEDQMEGGWHGGSSGSNSYGSQLPSPRDYSDMGY